MLKNWKLIPYPTPYPTKTFASTPKITPQRTPKKTINVKITKQKGFISLDSLLSSKMNISLSAVMLFRK